MNPEIVKFIESYGYELSENNRFDDSDITWDVTVMLIEEFTNHIS